MADGKLARAQLAQNQSSMVLALSEFMKADLRTLLPAAGDATNLGLIAGTFGTNAPSLKGSDSKVASITEVANREIVIPPDYVSGDLTLRLHAGLLTTVSDTTALLDVKAHKSDEEAAVGADICDTAAEDINSLTLADKDFTILGASLSPGDVITIEIEIAIVDGATGTVVQGVVGSAKLLYDRK